MEHWVVTSLSCGTQLWEYVLQRALDEKSGWLEVTRTCDFNVGKDGFINVSIIETGQNEAADALWRSPPMPRTPPVAAGMTMRWTGAPGAQGRLTIREGSMLKKEMPLVWVSSETWLMTSDLSREFELGALKLHLKGLKNHCVPSSTVGYQKGEDFANLICSSLFITLQGCFLISVGLERGFSYLLCVV